MSTVRAPAFGFAYWSNATGGRFVFFWTLTEMVAELDASPSLSV